MSFILRIRHDLISKVKTHQTIIQSFNFQNPKCHISFDQVFYSHVLFQLVILFLFKGFDLIYIC